MENLWLPRIGLVLPIVEGFGIMSAAYGQRVMTTSGLPQPAKQYYVSMIGPISGFTGTIPPGDTDFPLRARPDKGLERVEVTRVVAVVLCK